MRSPVPTLPSEMPRLPPGLIYRLRDVTGLIGAEPAGEVALHRLERLADDGEPWLSREPGLAELGWWMIEAGQPSALRVQGCVWLTMFPSAETAGRLAAIALDPAVAPAVREQAVWSLGYRQARAMDPAGQWPEDAVAIADDALAALVRADTAAGAVAVARLPEALRHVAAPAVLDLLGTQPALWGEAFEGFATPALAHTLFARIEELGSGHRLRALRLAGATLGEEALPILRARAGEAPLDERLEMRFLAITFGGEGELGALEDELREMKYADLLRKRGRWHLEHPGVVPTVRGLRVARTTGLMPAAARASACAQAADDLGALTRFARHPEYYLYELWAWMAHGSGDPARATALVAAHPESQPVVKDLYLHDLARRGRVKQLAAAAQALEGADAGALGLAVYGRPMAGLELAATARLHTAELVCARALACYRVGRPDLMERILTEDLPPSEITDETELAPFPGPHERWLAAHAPAARPAVTALVGGRAAVLAMAEAAAAEAEADRATLEPIAAVVRRLGRGLPGSTVYLAGEFGVVVDKAAVTAAIDRAGARLVSGPFPGTDYYVHGDHCLVQTIAQLERQGARRLRAGELEGIP